MYSRLTYNDVSDTKTSPPGQVRGTGTRRNYPAQWGTE